MNTRVLIITVCLFAFRLTIAQTGPGGVGSGTTSVELWLDGRHVNNDGTNPAVGATVTTWFDQSGNNVDVTANIVSPVVATYSANGLVFANNGYMAGSDATFPSGNAARTVIVCASSPSTATDDVLFFYGTSNNNQSFGILKILTSNGVRSFFYGNDQDIAGGFTPSGTMKIITSSYTSNTQVTHVNNNAGTSRTPGATVNTTLGAQGLQIGGWNSFTLNSQATIGEVILYNKVLNPAERIIVNNYLSAKFGLTLAANDLYDNDDVGFDYDVAGIGRAANATETNTDARGSIIQISNAAGLGNNEYYIWGHDNGALTPTTAGIPAGVQARLTRIWRGSETGTITSFDVHVDMTNLGTVNTSHLALLIDTDGDGSFADETVAGGGIVTGSTLVSGLYRFSTVTAINNDTRFTIATTNTSTTPLPVTLTSFTATHDNGTVKLKWATAVESQNDHFTIERSRNGHDFELVDIVPGNVDSNIERNYQLVDTDPFLGTSYYRLSQTDVDGTTEYFPLTNIFVPSYEAALIHPNPSDGEIKINLQHFADSENVTITIFNQRGKEVFSTTIDPNFKTTTSLMLTRDKFTPGIYFVKVRSGRRVESAKVLIR
jgi:hypothetical protein